MIRIFIIASLLMATLAHGQNALNTPWYFQKGDDLTWAKPDFDHSKWPTINASQLWEEQGYTNYDGYGWYRNNAIIPSEWQAQAKKYGGLVLDLAKIDDADYVYFNGEFIGKTGEFPPNYRGEYDTPRKYIIPIEKVRWGASNCVAVRVYDDGGGGGIYAGTPQLSPRTVADFLDIQVQMPRADNVLPEGSMMSKINISNSVDEKVQGNMELIVRDDMGNVVSQNEQAFSIMGNEKIFINMDKPTFTKGFYHGELTLKLGTIRKTKAFHFAVAPEQMRVASDAPSDFDDYWKRARKELDAVAPQYKMRKLDSLCTEKRDVYLVEMRSLGNVLIHGFYSVPKRSSGKLATILHVQGYTTYMGLDVMSQEDDFISFGLNIRGHGNSRDNVNPGFPGFLQYFINDKEQYIYRGAYMDCTRALDFLCSRPEVDAQKIIVEGSSQGGALSFATAALNPDRVRACVPSIPFLSDFREYFKVAYWPNNEFVDYQKANPSLSWETIYNTLSYIDIKNLAPMIRCPLLMSVGLRDDVCPPRINFAAYNNVSSPKEWVAYPDSGHSLPWEYNNYKHEWIRRTIR